MNINLEFQVDVANRKEGRFIPYIGKDYEKGLVSKDKDIIGRFSRDSDKNETGVKILVIGPRHYCDAQNNIRNRLARLTKKDWESINCGSSTFPPHCLKLGCIEEDAKGCLEHKWNNCPVFRNEDARCCPVSKECNIKESFPCDKERNLRCETLIAIKDYLDSIRVIESQNVGKHFFNSITNIIDKVYKPKSKDSKYIWSCIAFSNLIQRYISTVFTEDQEISMQVIEDDRMFIQEVIEQLKPDIIIATKNCVKTHLSTVVRNLHYGEWKPYPDDFYMCENNNKVVDFEKWKEILKVCIEKCHIWKKSSEYNGFINGVINGLKDMKDRHLITMPQMDEVYVCVRKLLTEKIEVGLKAGERVDKTMDKNFSPEGKYYQPNGVTTMAQWLRKYKPNSAIQKKAYEEGKRVLEELLSGCDY